MSAITVELPNALRARLEEIAKETGVSLADLLIDAADRMSQVDTLERIKNRAQMRDTRAGFKRFLDAVPDVPPIHPDDVIK